MDWVNTFPMILVLGIFVVIFGNLLYDSLKTLVAQREPKASTLKYLLMLTEIIAILIVFGLLFGFNFVFEKIGIWLKKK